MKRLALIAVLVAILVSATSVNLAFARPETPKDLVKVVFIHHKALAKPSAAKGPKSESSYKLFLGGVKWRTLPVYYQINTGSVSLSGIDSALARSEIKAAFEEWDNNTGKELFNNTVGETSLAGAILDRNNTVAWVSISDPSIIARTTFWYSPFTKSVVEFDMELNTYFKWGVDADGEGGAFALTDAMDIQNIVTHEAGHTLVLLDLYSSTNSEVTMYGYSDFGEVKKISLAGGDLDGLRKLYGF